MDGFVGGGCGSADQQRAALAKGKVIGGDAGLECGEDEDLAGRGELEDGAAAVADIEKSIAIEGKSGRNSHTFGKHGFCTAGSDSIDRSLVARRDVEISFRIEGDSGGVQNPGDEGANLIF